MRLHVEGFGREVKEASPWITIAVASTVSLITTALGKHTHVLDYVLLAISASLLVKALVLLVRRKRVSVDVLMGVAGLTTWFLHLTISGFLILLLYSISELIEIQAERYAERKIVGLRELIPTKVSVEVDGKIVSRSIDELKPGDVVIVKPGEVVPADGIIIDGHSLFDTSYITGESEPRPLGKGGHVMSGYVNKSGMVRVRVLKDPGKSLLQLLVLEAERALERKASLQRFIERFSQPYTVLILSMFTAGSLLTSPYKALPLLLAGCPSAFIISSGTATALALATLARKSVVVRGGRVLEDLERVKVLVLDKTGTITLGELKLSRLITLNGFSEDLVREYVGGAAKASNHPVSRALAGLSEAVPSKVQEFPGKGVKALVNGAEVLLGSKEFLAEHGVDVGVAPRCSEGEMVAYVAVNRVLAGVACLEEGLDSGIREVFQAVKRRGLRTVIASGDRRGRVERVARFVGADEFFYELSPDEKKALVRRLREKYGAVGFVGDGVNDVEAIAEADVGMAVGRLEVVSNIGDVVLIRGIKSVPLLLDYASRFGKAVRSAILTAAAVKVAVIATGIAGLIPYYLVVAVGDDGATLMGLGLIMAFLLGKGKVNI